jgi:5-hydroxyisourate hydrolase
MSARPGLSTHVLDLTRGQPAAGMTIELHIGGAHIKTVVTNADGRTDAPLVDAEAFAAGDYELIFHVGDYFARANDRAGSHTESIPDAGTGRDTGAGTGTGSDADDVSGSISGAGAGAAINADDARGGLSNAGTSAGARADRFLDRVPVRFIVHDPRARYHVPLLCSPWAYSTYRGS